MSEVAPVNSPEAVPSAMPHQARRDRWASTVATLAVATHSLAALVVFGWYYFILPRWKQELDSFGIKLSRASIFLIAQSDMVVNYWYLPLPLVPVAVICDFLTTRWIAKQIGLRWASLGVVIIAVVLLANVVVGKYVVAQEQIRCVEHISIHGLPPK